MNLLGIVQRIQLECAVSGTITTAQNPSGETQRLVTWANAAWYEVQTEHDDWFFRRSSNALGAGASFTTVAGTAFYPLGTGAGTCGITAANFGKWAKETFRTYTTSVGTGNETRLDEIEFDEWREAYIYGANRTVQTRPCAVAFGPDESVCLGPPPNALYTVTGDYFLAPTQMSADADLPTGLPAEFHMLIVYKAMQMYAGYESASEVYQRGDAGYRLLLAQLEALKLPTIMSSGALA